jgi:hypothetical protein
MWALWSALAAAQTCDASALDAPGATVSVAWVSPVRARAGARRWLWVVPTKELRAFAETHETGRVLQWLGEQRKDRPPRRRWKVVVFDATPADLCRPLADDGAGDVAGVARCDERRSPGPDRTQSCGQRLDRATGKPAVDVYRSQWASLATNGFCVLPLERL